MLEALLTSGIHIKRLLYCDKDPRARQVMRKHLIDLQVRFPDLLDSRAVEKTFDVPQDVECLTLQHLDELSLIHKADTWLVSAGWPCQDLSPIGLSTGLQGSRSGLVGHALRII